MEITYLPDRMIGRTVPNDEIVIWSVGAYGFLIPMGAT